MTRFPVGLFAGVMILTLLTPLIGSRAWFPHNRFGTIVLLLAGCAIGGMLWAAGIPPKWLNGSAAGFTISLTLMASGFAFQTAEEKFYRMPWLIGFGGTLLVANIAAHV
jgi:hypothetical protein